MRTLLTYTLATSLVVAGACKRQDDTQQPPAAPAPTATYAAYQGYPPPQATYSQYPPQYPPQQYPSPPPAATYGYPAAPPATQAPPPAPAPQAAPPPAAPASSGQMAVPSAVAFPCQNDLPCGTHHCNLQYGKCAFPCQSNVDCISPNTCVMGLCAPAPPSQH